MTAKSKGHSDSPQEGGLKLLKGLLLGIPAIAALSQLMVWILNYHTGIEEIGWVSRSALLASLGGVLVSAAAVGYRPKDNLLWYAFILNCFVAMQGMLLFLLAYIVLLELLWI